MPIYKRADHSVVEHMQKVMDAHHPVLRDAGVKVDVVLAFAKTNDNGDAIESALKLHGYPCAAVVKILGPKDRAMGRGDAEITIDADAWPTRPVEQQSAIFDHELNHLDLKFDKKGALRQDDDGRPKLKIKLHDFQFGWFKIIAVRHREHSLEVQQAEVVFTEGGQILFPFAAGVSRVEKAEAFLAGKKEPDNGLGKIFTKAAMEGPAREIFGSALQSIEDGPDGPILTINADNAKTRRRRK